jgi:hypothetical protein
MCMGGAAGDGFGWDSGEYGGLEPQRRGPTAWAEGNAREEGVVVITT